MAASSSDQNFENVVEPVTRPSGIRTSWAPKYTGKTLIMIEGAIGAGKSTMLDRLRMDKTYRMTFLRDKGLEPTEKCIFVEEPVNRVLLKKFYSGKMSKLHFQLHVLQSRFHALLQKVCVMEDRNIFIADRYLYGDFAFALTNLSFEEMQVYLPQWYAVYVHMTYFFNNQLMITLPYSSQVDLNVQKRGRQGEEAVTPAYQKHVLKCLSDIHVFTVGIEEFCRARRVAPTINEFFVFVHDFHNPPPLEEPEPDDSLATMELPAPPSQESVEETPAENVLNPPVVGVVNGELIRDADHYKDLKELQSVYYTSEPDVGICGNLDASTVDY